MYYCDIASRWMEVDVLYHIRNVKLLGSRRLSRKIRQWIPTSLATDFSLDFSAKKKLGLYVRDLDLISHHHRVLNKDVYLHERIHIQKAAALGLIGAAQTGAGTLLRLQGCRFADCLRLTANEVRNRQATPL